MRYLFLVLLLSGCHEYLGERVEATIDGYTDYDFEREDKPDRLWIESKGVCPIENFRSVPLEYYFAERNVIVINMMVYSGFEWRRECNINGCFMFRDGYYRHHLRMVDDRTVPIATCVGDELILVVFEDNTFITIKGEYDETL